MCTFEPADLKHFHAGAHIVQTVANVLAVKEQGDRSLGKAIAERLATRHMLLVLDNAEHLIEQCAELACCWVAALREELGGRSRWSFGRLRFERRVAAARLKLHDDAAFDRAWNEGRSMTLVDAVRYALDA